MQNKAITTTEVEQAIDMYLSVDPNYGTPNEMAIELLTILNKLGQNEFESDAAKKAFYLSEVALLREKHKSDSLPHPSIAPLGLQLLKAGLITVSRETVRELINETDRHNRMLLGMVYITPLGEEHLKAGSSA